MRRESSVPRMRPDCTCRVFSTKLGIVVHNFVQRFKARSLKLASNRANRHTLKAAPAAAILVSDSGATGETKKAAQRFSAIGR
jgi:hypothetical protein